MKCADKGAHDASALAPISGLGADADRGQKEKSGRTIKSLDRALGLIDILAASKAEMPLSQIASNAQLNISTCHHLLATLAARGYVGQNPQTRSYFLGARIIELANARLKQFSLLDVATPELQSLNEITRESVHLASIQGNSLVTLLKLDSRLPVGVGSDELGKYNAAHATATGKAILAWLPEASFARVIADHGLTRFTPKTICDLSLLLEDLRLVRRNGYSVDDEEYQPGVVCVGAAIRDHAGAVVGSVSCSMPKLRAKRRSRDRVISAVRDCVAAISEHWGVPRQNLDASKI